MALVSLALAKDHLRIPQTTTVRDVDVRQRIDAAGAIIANYLTTAAVVTWDEYTTPPPVQAAVLIVLAHYDEHRGDDAANDAAMWDSVDRLLVRYRVSALA